MKKSGYDWSYGISSIKRGLPEKAYGFIQKWREKALIISPHYYVKNAYAIFKLDGAAYEIDSSILGDDVIDEQFDGIVHTIEADLDGIGCEDFFYAGMID